MAVYYRTREGAREDEEKGPREAGPKKPKLRL